ncbi:ead/Ea22-like family protein [Escherichia coli]|nr:ead/Ea22-like family protein [Escherichia coli]MCV5562950.1 ead/Ea22-like family protein [Escherichia coli]
MSKIDYQVLREAAVAIETVATPQKLLAFRMKVTPQVVLALLDERERNQQYIKRRDQENEDIALTVGKLRVELEAAEKRFAELESLTAPKLPQPAVPDDAATAIRACLDEFPEDVRDIVEECASIAENSCRAAMLQGADDALTNDDTKRVGELVMWIKRLAHSLRKSNPDSKLQSDAMDYLSQKGLIGVKDILR